MDGLLILSGWLVAGVLTLAGFSKLQDAASTAQSLKEFGVPEALARQGARLLPWFELCLAALLLLPQVAWLAAVAAAMLLAAFTVAVSVALMRGQHPSCNCFGQVRARPIGPATALRNTFFTACAVLLATSGAAALEPGLLGMTLLALGRVQATMLVVVALALVVAVQFWLMLHLTRQHGRLLLKVDNLELKMQGLGVPVAGQFVSAQVPARGTAAPIFEATALSGRPLKLQSLLAERKPLLLLFVSAECAPCKELIAEVPQWLPRGGHERLMVVSSGGLDANRGKFPGLSLDWVAVQVAFEINELYGVMATPSAMRLDSDGNVNSGLAVGSDAIKQLFASAEMRPGMGLPELMPGTGRD